jgi:acetolactate decarboxylase
MMFAVRTFLCLVLLAGAAGCGALPAGHDTLYQVSTRDALREGDYEGEVPVAVLQRRGDTGLGVFRGLDGVMVAVGGRFYQVREDGHAYAASRRNTLAYAAVTWFEPDISESLGRTAGMEELQRALDSFRPREDTICAVLIKGQFDYIAARSVSAQEKPYRPLQNVLHGRPAFTYRSVPGVLVGFWIPESLRGVGSPGYTFHFLNHTRNRGGRVLDCRIKAATVQMDPTGELHLVLSGSREPR